MLRPFFIPLALIGVMVEFVLAEEPSEFRFFTDKRDQQIEARILSISEDERSMTLERKDGNVFEMAITVLSLDDQQFLREWLTPPPLVFNGSIEAFGQLASGNPIDMEAIHALSGVKNFFPIKAGWVCLHEDGTVSSTDARLNGAADIVELTCNTHWITLINRKGEVLDRKLEVQHPEILRDVVKSVAGYAHFAALLANGKIKLWGSSYKTDSPIDFPAEVPGAVALASNQGCITVLDKTGAVHQWKSDWDEVKTARPGNGVVALEGSIFTFLALTQAGEVFEWNGEPAKARIPKPLFEEGPFVKIRCNGNTRAAQREDGTWISWGTDGAGIVEKINELPPTVDLSFFSEPSKTEHGHLLYIGNDS